MFFELTMIALLGLAFYVGSKITQSKADRESDLRDLRDEITDVHLRISKVENRVDNVEFEMVAGRTKK